MANPPGTLPPTEDGPQRILHKMTEANDIQRDEHGNVRSPRAHVEPAACLHVHAFILPARLARTYACRYICYVANAGAEAVRRGCIYLTI